MKRELPACPVRNDFDVNIRPMEGAYNQRFDGWNQTVW